MICNCKKAYSEYHYDEECTQNKTGKIRYSKGDF